MKRLGKMALIIVVGSVTLVLLGLVARASHDLLFQVDADNRSIAIYGAGYTIFLNQFDPPLETRTITAVEIDFFDNLQGSSTEVLLYVDTDPDPVDAALVYRDQQTPANFPEQPHVYVIDPPLVVSSDQYVFAGVALKDRAVWCDKTVSGTRSWEIFAGASGRPFDPADLSLAGTRITLDSGNRFGHNCTWLIRAYASGVDSDADLDGFHDGAEFYFGTDVHDACSDNPDHPAWPLDMNNDAIVGVSDVLALKPAFGSSVGDENFKRRFDLDVDTTIDVGDVLMFKGHIFNTCE